MTAVREATPDALARLLAIQGSSLPGPSPALLRAGVTGPLCVLVAGAPPAGDAMAIVGGDVASLTEIAVAPGHRGEGIGSTLPCALLDRLTGRVRAIELVVQIENDPARAFYRDHGFRSLGTARDHYGTGDVVRTARAPRPRSAPGRSSVA